MVNSATGDGKPGAGKPGAINNNYQPQEIELPRPATEGLSTGLAPSPFGLLRKAGGDSVAGVSPSVGYAVAEGELTPAHQRMAEVVSATVPGLRLLALRARLAHRSARPVSVEDAVGWLAEALPRLEARFGRLPRFTEVLSLAAQTPYGSRLTASAGGQQGSGYAADLPGGSAADGRSAPGTDAVLLDSQPKVNYRMRKGPTHV